MLTIRAERREDMGISWYLFLMRLDTWFECQFVTKRTKLRCRVFNQFEEDYTVAEMAEKVNRAANKIGLDRD